MKKIDIIASFIIGEVCAIIFLLVSRFLELPSGLTKFTKFFPIVLPLLSIAGIYASWFLGRKWPTIFQMGKSFLVGILNTFIDLGVLNLLMWILNISFGWRYTFLKGISFCAATINSYFWNKTWAFEKKEAKTTTKEIGQFFSVAIGGLLINLLVASFVIRIGPHFELSSKIWANVGAIAAAFGAFLWNFFGYKLIVFKK